MKYWWVLLVALATVGALIGGYYVGFYLLPGFQGHEGYKEIVISDEVLDESRIIRCEGDQKCPYFEGMSMLTGELLSKQHVLRKPLAVVIENHRQARPQKGLDKADIVYEFVVEGGITRFLALFQSQEPDDVGPVRSARTYFLPVVKEYDAVFVHAGGSERALRLLASTYASLLDAEAFSYLQHFWRDTSRKVSMEHTLFTSGENLNKMVEENEWTEWSPPGQGWFFSENGRKGDEAKNISVDVSRALYEVGYEYDDEAGTYDRSLAGVSHKDGVTGDQLSPDNVVVMFVDFGLVGGKNPLGWVESKNIGEGEVMIFNDGIVRKGIWKKKDAASRMRFVDEEGKSLSLKPGQTWIHVVPKERKPYVKFS